MILNVLSKQRRGYIEYSLCLVEYSQATQEVVIPE